MQWGIMEGRFSKVYGLSQPQVGWVLYGEAFGTTGGVGSVWRGLRVEWAARMRADDSPRFGRKVVDHLGVATLAET